MPVTKVSFHVVSTSTSQGKGEKGRELLLDATPGGAADGRGEGARSHWRPAWRHPSDRPCSAFEGACVVLAPSLAPTPCSRWAEGHRARESSHAQLAAVGGQDSAPWKGEKGKNTRYKSNNGPETNARLSRVVVFLVVNIPTSSSFAL
jgi:hypothetical protein